MRNLNDPRDIEEVKEAFDAYENALLSNDVLQLESFFWNSAWATRFGAGEQLYGYQAIVEFRRNRKLNFSYRTPVKLIISTFSDGCASVMYEYESDIDGVATRGRQSQTWARIQGEWKIMSAHISYLSTEDSIDAALALLDLKPKPEWRKNIAANFATTNAMANRLMRFPIPETLESDSVFEP